MAISMWVPNVFYIMLQTIDLTTYVYVNERFRDFS